MQWKDYLNESEEDGLSGGFGGGYHNYETKTVLSYAIVCTDKFGYGKSDSRNSTSGSVKDLIFDLPKTLEEWQDSFNVNVYKADFETDAVNQQVEDIIQYYTTLDNDTEFIHNIKVILKSNYCTHKDIGLIACLPYSHDKAMEYQKYREQKQAEQISDIEIDKLSVYYGEEKKRYTINNLEIKCLTSYETMYGITYIYKFRDLENHVFIWKTSNGFDTDKQYNITFTVKEHSDYREVKQTSVTRCKLIEVK
jgi:hypothetical protein